MILTKPRLIVAYFFTAFLLVCVGLFANISTIYASEGEDEPQLHILIYEDIVAIDATIDTMVVNASWIDDEMIRIDVVDITTGTVSSLAVRLSDFVANADAQSSRYILIQAVDLDGNISGIVQIDNPFYVSYIPKDVVLPSDLDGEYYSTEDETDTESTEMEAPQLGLTPDGTGTVVDNVVTQNEIEFFTVFTEEGNTFFLVVDRQRNTDNVYLLNAVTEADLMALAERSGNPIDNNVNIAPTPPPLPPPTVEPEQQTPPLPQSTPDITETSSSRNNSNLVLIAVVMVVAGGIAYYFKIVRGRKSSPMLDDDWDYEDDEEEDSYLGDGEIGEVYEDEGGDRE